jgi:O-antigen/teichoic acid export membrane protein
MIADIIRTLRVSTPELIIGRALGLDAVAFFNRASSMTGQFYGLIGQAAQKVAFPYFAQERREGRDIKPVYLTAVAYFTGLGWPFFAVLALLAEPAVLLLFGDQWEASIPLTRITCLGAAISLPWSMLANVANAMGQPRITMRVELQLLLATIMAVALGSTVSIQAVAWALCGVSAIHSWLVARALRGLIGVRFRDCSGDLLKSAGVSLVSVLAALPGMFLVPQALGDAGQLAAGLGGAGIGWVVTIVWQRHPLMRELPRASAVLRSWLRL